MAKIADVLITEANRKDPAEWDKIHLFQMGDFYRAYEWSAWLISVISYNDEVRKQSKDRKPLKLSRKKLANSETTFCFVGFPIKSVEKFIPTRRAIVLRWQPTPSTPRVHLLPLLRQRQRPVMEQPWFERQLLVSFAQLADERQEPELQLRRSQPAEQQQPLQLLHPQGSAALIDH